MLFLHLSCFRDVFVHCLTSRWHCNFTDTFMTYRGMFLYFYILITQRSISLQIMSKHIDKRQIKTNDVCNEKLTKNTLLNGK